MSTTPTYLTNCEMLQAEPWHECTQFSRFVLFRPKPRTGSGTSTPPVATLPTDFKFRDAKRLDLVVEKADATLKNLKVKFPVTGPDPAPDRPGSGKITTQPVAGLGNIKIKGKLQPAQRIQALKSLHPTAVQMDAISYRVPGMPAVTGFRIPVGSLLEPVFKAVRDYVQIATEAKSQAVWAIGLNFEQCWLSKGYLRGRLVRSLPLTPGEQLEIVIKTWDKRTQRKSQVESVARHISTEVTGEEKWMLATKMTFSDQANASINPSAGAKGGLTIPIETVTADVGGNLGLTGSFANQLSQGTQNGTDYIHSSMMKAAHSLQTSRTNSVELSHEAGEEVTRKQVIANTNRCHTLTYHYFEVMERFEVKTKFDSASLYLLIPLPLPEVTPEWVLCNECFLRRIVPCETLYAGFQGAKTLLEWAKLVDLYPAAATPPSVTSGQGASGSSTGDYASPFTDAVKQVLERWAILTDAQLLAFGGNAGAGDDLLGAIAAGGQAVADGLGKLASDAAAGVDAAIDTAGQAVDAGLKMIGDGIQAAGEGLGNLAGAVFFSRSPMQALTTRRTEGGPGTWLYREVAKIAAPQIAESMSFLETAWPQTQTLPAGERALAEFNVLQIFFSKLGMPAFTFGKVDALFAGAAAAAVGAGTLGGAAAGAATGAGIGAAICVWGYGVSAIPGALIGGGIGGAVGGAAGGAAVASVLALIASLEALGLADTIPDDEGLKDAAQRLKALVDTTTAMAPANGLPGSGGSTDGNTASGVSVQDQWREQMRQLAEAQVEYERLACHLNKNLMAYMQGLWSQWSDYQILNEVRRHGIPEDVIAPRFEGFYGSFGAIPVVDEDWLSKEGGLDWEKTATDLTKKAEKQTRIEEITLSTPGMTVEPALGKCDACEPFIEEHRKLDLENRRAEVDIQKAKALQEGYEADRFKQRLAQDKLDDPTPLEGAAVTVEMKEP